MSWLDKLRPKGRISAAESSNDSEHDALGLIAGGNSEERQGRLEAALELYDRAARLAPRLAAAPLNRGIALLALGRAEDAIAAHRQALALDPHCAAAHYNRGNAQMVLKQPRLAVESYHEAIRLRPDFAEAQFALGIAQEELGELDAAAHSFARALHVRPDYAEVHANLAQLLVRLGRLEESIASYSRAIELRPDFVELHFPLAELLSQRADYEAAVASYRLAVNAAPQFTVAHNNLGNALKGLGRYAEAIASYRAALDCHPDNAEILTNIGGALDAAGLYDEAVTTLRRAIAVNPDIAMAHFNLGNARLNQGMFEDAESSFRRSLAIAPNSADAHCNLGIALVSVGRLAEGVACFRQALAIDPDYALAQSNLLFACNYQAEHDPASLITEARRFGGIAVKRAPPFTRWSNERDPHRRLRVGVVSPDLREHAAGHFAQSALIALAGDSKAAVDIYGYYNNTSSDAVTANIKAACRGWHEVRRLSDAQLAQLVRDDGIDILIDLAGHTADNRLLAMAPKPAPVQATWLGYFATTGVEAIDYLIADPWTVPPEGVGQFTERIWYLPETRLCFTPPNVEIEVGDLPALRNGYITFGCCNTLSKINDDVIALWARILAAIPGSRLFMMAKQLGEPPVREALIARFDHAGVEPSRLTFRGPAMRAEYLAAYHAIDIALDPFPFPGGATSAEALWMGVPVLTLAGDRFISRQGIGLLMNAGLPDWVAASPDDYVARAVSHAHDVPRLAALRRGLRRQVLASPAFDAPRFAHHLGAALRGMWSAWCAESANQPTASVASDAATAPHDEKDSVITPPPRHTSSS